MTNTTTGKDFLDVLATGLTTLFSDGMEYLLGPSVRNVAYGSITWADLGATCCFLLFILLANGLAASILRRKIREAAARPETTAWHHHLWGAAKKPFYLLIWICGIYLAATPLLLKFPENEELQIVRQFFDKLLALGVFAALFWLFFRFTHVLEARLAGWAGKTKNKLDDLFVPLLGRSLRVIVPVVGIIFALPVIGLPPEYSGVVAKGSSILIIGTVAWILSQAVHLGEKAVLAEYDITAADNLRARKVFTQVHVISKTLYVVIGIFTIASILMLFDEVRRFGTSILASAGVIGIIAGFAAQKTIANLFAGFQLAMTQPIRLDDVVIVENEWGHVEEITLTYVVIHIWDDRRLIVPLSYFIEKPFQNWTRATADLMGSVLIWVDYSLSLDEARKALKQIVEGSPLWDKRFWNLQVTDMTERTMQIRVLVTAANSSKLWDLRCEIREKFIAYIQKNHSKSLPRLRTDLRSLDGGTTSCGSD